MKKLENVKKDHEKRLDALKRDQELDRKKAELIEMNLPLVKLSVEACLHIPTPSPSSFIIVLIVTGRLTVIMGSTPILPIRQPVTIGTIIKLDGV